MRKGTARVFDALGRAARDRVLAGAGIDVTFQYGFVVGVQMMQVDPGFAAALLRDFLGGERGDDHDVAMYWNAEQTIAALREAFEEE